MTTLLWLAVAVGFAPGNCEEIARDQIDVSHARKKFKEPILEVPLAVVAFPSTYQRSELEAQLVRFNNIYQKCSIQIQSPVPVFIQSEDGYEDKTWGATRDNLKWVSLVKPYSEDRIPVFYLSGDRDLPGTIATAWSYRDYKKDLGPNAHQYPDFFIFSKSVSRFTSQKDGLMEHQLISNLAHELGHILFSLEHTEERGSLMTSHYVVDDRLVGGQKIATEDCRRSRAFLKNFPNRKNLTLEEMHTIEEEPSVFDRWVERFFRASDEETNVKSVPAR